MKASSYRIKPQDRLLYLRLSAIGDVINAIPGLVALRRSYPDNYIAWCVEDLSAELLQGHPLLDDLLVIKQEWLRHPLKARNLKELRDFIAHLRSQKFTVAIDAHNLFKSGLFSLLSGAKVRIGANLTHNYEGHKFLLNVLAGPAAAKDAPSGPAAVRRARFLAYIGVDLTHLQYVLPPFTTESARIDAILSQAGYAGNGPIVVLNPCASWPARQWPGNYYVQLGLLLLKNPGAYLVWTGSRREMPYEKQFADQVPSLNLAGRLNLRELAALLQKAGLIVTGDTGPMHLGAAMGTYVVALMGPTDPLVHGPFTEKSLILSSEMPCRYCKRKICGDMRCMSSLSPAYIAGKISGLPILCK